MLLLPLLLILFILFISSLCYLLSPITCLFQALQIWCFEEGVWSISALQFWSIEALVLGVIIWSSIPLAFFSTGQSTPPNYHCQLLLSYCLLSRASQQFFCITSSQLFGHIRDVTSFRKNMNPRNLLLLWVDLRALRCQHSTEYQCLRVQRSWICFGCTIWIRLTSYRHIMRRNFSRH